MNKVYLLTTAVAIAAVIGALTWYVVHVPAGPSLNKLLNETSTKTYTANYEYVVYSNIAGQVTNQIYEFTYSQRGLSDRYIAVTMTSQPQMSLYIVTTQLSNGSLIQCVVQPIYAGCFSTNQTFNLVNLVLPITNSSKFKLVGTQRMLNYSTYCYVSRNVTALGNIMPAAIQSGLGSLPVNVTSEICMTSDGIPLLLRLSVFTTLSIGGYSAPLNITQALLATSVEDGVYLSNNATLLLSRLGINATG
ncbi:MAG: hypothetical protein L7H00_00130 [Vulcanisaeta sp.]|nr:hypothetical protein [Vulcanisaeta sp.]MCG2894657.1 hypothetical protein [Vulcanisaeta sp.]